MQIVVTGGAGFIGSQLVHLLLETRPEWQIVNFDALTYSGNLENVAGLEANSRYRFLRGDVADPEAAAQALAGADAVIHLAAESHVDRSIQDAGDFIRTNVTGTQTLLDAARRGRLSRFVQVSTDEVYGSLGNEGRFSETSPLAPNSPYAASKAAADLLARAAFHTHGVPVIITRASNNYGPRQFPEKLIPLVISNALAGEPVPLYGRGENVRNWIHAADHCRGILVALERGTPGEIYNFGGDDELDNLSLVKRLLRLAGAGEELIRYVADRLGHDFRYSLDSSRARRELGWRPEIALDAGLTATVDWYRQHPAWLRRARGGDFQSYYARQYEVRLQPAAAPAATHRPTEKSC